MKRILTFVKNEILTGVYIADEVDAELTKKDIEIERVKNLAHKIVLKIRRDWDLDDAWYLEQLAEIDGTLDKKVPT